MRFLYRHHRTVWNAAKKELLRLETHAHAEGRPLKRRLTGLRRKHFFYHRYRLVWRCESALRVARVLAVARRTDSLYTLVEARLISLVARERPPGA
jgi:hypothetical protein